MNVAHPRGTSLVNRLTVAAIVAVLICAAVVGTVATWLAAQSLEKQALGTLSSISTASSVRIGDWVSSNQRLVGSAIAAGLRSPASLTGTTTTTTATATPATGASDAAAAANPDAALVQALKQNVAAGQFRLAFMAFDSDHRYIRTPESPLPADYDPTARPWYKLAVQSGQPVVTAPYRDVSDNNLIVSFDQVVMSDGKRLGVVGAVTSLTDVIKIIAAIKPTEHSYAFVTDGDDRVIVHPNVDYILKPAHSVMPWLSQATDASAVAMKTDQGRATWVRTLPIPNSNWKLTVVFDKADSLSGLTTLVASIAAAAALVVACVAFFLARLLRRNLAPLRSVRDAMVTVAGGQGDLTTRINVAGSDEVSQIASAFNAFNETLRRIMSEVQAASAEVKLAADEIAMGNRDLSSRTETQAGTIQESASAMHEITQASASNAHHAQEANRIVRETADLAESGGVKVADVVTTMKDITESSKRIGEIIGVIDGIAFQTNILALNAAVEAARAGEQGRGFAVVAGEVRTLAQRSATAARDIRELIKHSASSVEMGAMRVDDAGATISRVVESVRSVSQLMAQIVEASEQQTGGIVQVKDAVSQIDFMTQQNSALVEQASAAAQSLSDQSLRLTEAVGRFNT